MDAYQEALRKAANMLPDAVLQAASPFPEECGPHQVSAEEWSIRDQLLHLQWLELRYTIPNLLAIQRGGEWAGWGELDREPDRGEPLAAIRERLAGIYRERTRLLEALPDDAWDRSISGEDGHQVTVEEIVTEECAGHDGEHLAQLLYTFDDWRKKTGANVSPGAALAAAGPALSAAVAQVIQGMPQEYAPHRMEGEWSIDEQVRHILYVEERFVLPNITAIRQGTALSPYNATAGKDDLVPGGASLQELAAELERVYAERNRLLGELTASEWSKTARDERGRDISPEYIAIYECVGHDGEHLSQLLRTARRRRPHG